MLPLNLDFGAEIYVPSVGCPSNPSARGADFIWRIFHEQSQLRVGLVSQSSTLKYLYPVACFMSTEKREKEDEMDERLIAEEGANVDRKTAQSPCVWTFISMTSSIVFTQMLNRV